MLVALQAVGLHGGDRAAITRSVFGIKITNGVLGNFTINNAGDTSLVPITIYRQSGKALLPVKTITPPANLIG
jgi:hypothetical protein